ncbi:MAG: thiamine pyrophosphate-binding protein [Promethearchaeota archaeon]
MNSGELIADVLKKQNVKFLFTLCGGHISPIIVGAKKEGLRVIDVRHEATAVFAADAISRLTGIPGVAAVTAGPGVTNSITAVKNAQMAQSAIIILGGAAATMLKGRGALQDIEQIELYKTITKWVVSIEQDCDIVPILEEAFDVAMSGIPGPVFIECPIDLLYDEQLVKKWYGIYTRNAHSDSIKDKITNLYVRRHIDKLFACSPKKTEIPEPSEITPFLIDQQKIQIAASQINNVSKPLLIIGSQAMLRIEEIFRLKSAINKMGIPTYCTGMARGLLGDHNPLQFHHKRTSALKKADLVILAGVPLDFRLDYGRSINEDAFLITINRDKEVLSKNKKADLGIQADPSICFQEIAKISTHEAKYNSWIKILNENEGEGEKKIQKFLEIQTNFINPLILCQKINKYIDDNSIIIGDGGDFIATASYMVKPKKPLGWLDPGPYGTLGVGAGFALAAKLTHPDTEVWLLYGDGAAGYSIMEFDTFCRHNIPIISVIGNNACWGQIARDQISYLNDDVGTVLKYSNYDLVVQGLGAKGFSIDNENQIDKFLKLAKNHAKEGYPTLINALIGNTGFRKGSISM